MSPEQLLGQLREADPDGNAWVVADCEAGIGTAVRLAPGAVDVAVLVVEASPKSWEVGRRAAEVAREKGVGRVVVVANRVGDAADLDRLRQVWPRETLLVVPEDPAVLAADSRGRSVVDDSPDAPAVRALATLADRLG